MTLSQGLSDYLAVRRSLGFDLSFEERVLRVFPRFADREGTDHITVDLPAMDKIYQEWNCTGDEKQAPHRRGIIPPVGENYYIDKRRHAGAVLRT